MEAGTVRGGVFEICRRETWRAACLKKGGSSASKYGDLMVIHEDSVGFQGDFSWDLVGLRGDFSWDLVGLSADVMS